MNSECTFYSQKDGRCRRREILTSEKSIMAIRILVHIGNWGNIVAPLVSNILLEPSNGEPIGNGITRCMVPTIGIIPILSIQEFCNGYCPSERMPEPIIDKYTTDPQAIGMIVQFLAIEGKNNLVHSL